MPTIPNAPLGEDASVAETEKLAVSGSKWMAISTIVEYLRTKAQVLTNKTLTAPTIADFTNANHDHGDADDGGALSAPTIADFTNAAHDHGDANDGGVVIATPIIATAIFAASNPADATTYHWGARPGSLNVTAASSRIYFRRACTITNIDTIITCSVGDNTATSLYLRLNNTTDTTLSTTLDFSATTVVLASTVSIAIAAGDYVEFKLVTPTWPTTNPTNMTGGAQIYATTT